MLGSRPHVLCLLAIPFIGMCGPGRAAEAPCESYVPAVIGGPVPSADSDTVAVRWLGNANYEFAYKGKVYLFDAYFNRKARSHDIGFKAEQVTRADAVFVSHAHFDHISDVAPVAKQTKAPIIGAQITVDEAIRLGVPKAQTVVAKNGDVLKYGDATIDIALARHSTIQDGLQAALGAVYAVDTRPDSPEEKTLTAYVRSLGSNDPAIIDKGTLAFALTFPSGWKAVVIGSAGPVTDGDRELAQKIGPVDLAIVAYQPHAVAERQIADTWPLIELFKPKLFLPAHHDASFGTWLDLGLEPLFLRLREDMPGTRFLAPLYRSPICIATSGAKKGEVTSFKY
jgi:L-ascorbate metabolism protein UlaG (beta-lactamase superfamily)